MKHQQRGCPSRRAKEVIIDLVFYSSCQKNTSLTRLTGGVGLGMVLVWGWSLQWFSGDNCFLRDYFSLSEWTRGQVDDGQVVPRPRSLLL